jgi:hypothetical protein
MGAREVMNFSSRISQIIVLELTASCSGMCYVDAVPCYV